MSDPNTKSKPFGYFCENSSKLSDQSNLLHSMSCPSLASTIIIPSISMNKRLTLLCVFLQKFENDVLVITENRLCAILSHESSTQTWWWSTDEMKDGHTHTSTQLKSDRVGEMRRIVLDVSTKNSRGGPNDWIRDETRNRIDVLCDVIEFFAPCPVKSQSADNGWELIQSRRLTGSRFGQFYRHRFIFEVKRLCCITFWWSEITL